MEQHRANPSCATCHAKLDPLGFGLENFDAVGAWFTPQGNYRDVPAPEEGAFGPAEVAARLRLGLEPLARYEHVPGWTIVAGGDTVMTEHVERWTWASGETVALPFVSVQRVVDGRIALWKDYWDLQTLMQAAPQSWHDRLDTADLSWVVDVTGRA